MKKIGNFCRILGSAAVLLTFLSLQVVAQSNVTVEATVSENTSYTGERIQLSIQISGDFSDITRPELPEFEGLRLLSNTPSTSRSYQYINGQSSTSYTYSYQLIAQQEGTFEIPSIPITIDGEKHVTDPITVEIINRNESARSSGDDRPEIFLQLEVSDRQPVQGQQVVADVVLYFRDGLEVNSYQPIPGWKAEGFWKEELENSNRPQATSTVLNGVRYRKARLLQFAVFPTKSGELEISPYKIVVSVRSSRSREDSFSSFFGGFGSNQRQVELETDPVALNVQPLPDIPEEEYFGAVGNFNISRNISTRNAVEGESIEITTRISGTGNIPLISKPEYTLPDGIEVYEPRENENINRRNGLISGTKTFTDVIIARSAKNYTIPEKEIAYYNPSQNSYTTQTLPALNIAIERNPDRVTVDNNNRSLPVTPVTGLASWSVPNGQPLFSYWWFWAGIIIPTILLAVAYRQKSYIDKMQTDRAFARSKKASDKADQRLEDAITLSEKGNIKGAYNMLQKAITGFISDRLNLPEAGLSNNDIIKALQKEDIDKELVKNIRLLLDKCASISYAPSTSHEYLKSHVGLAQSTLDKLKKVL